MRVQVGRVGKPHGLAGAFFVEQASDDADRFTVGATLLVAGEPAEVVESKRAGGRPVIRLDREVDRARRSRSSGARSRSPTKASTTPSSSSASRCRRREARSSGASSRSRPPRQRRSRARHGPRCCPSSTRACRRSISRQVESLCSPASRPIANLTSALRIDVFTLIPHAFAWLTEQRPLASVLGTELELRLLNYRDTTPLKAGQVDDEPYGGGAGMVLRVDVVAAALDAAYGGPPEHRVVALTPQGRQLDQQLVEELAGESQLTLLSARFEGFDERIVEHLATDAVSIGPYVLSGGELPAMVLLDAIARRLPGALGSEESGPRGKLLRPSSREGSSTRTTPGPRSSAAGACPRCCSRATTGASPSGAASRAARGPSTEKPDRRTHARPAAPVAHRHRLGGDDPRRRRDRARDQGLRRQPVPHPVLVDGADAALRPAGSRAAWRDSRTACSRTGSSTTSGIRTAARSSSSRLRRRAALACGGEGGTFVKRLIGLPGDRWREQDGYIYINGARLDEPYIEAARRDSDDDPREDGSAGRVSDARRQPLVLVRFTPLGHCSAQEPRRAGVRDLLAAEARSASDSRLR